MGNQGDIINMDRQPQSPSAWSCGLTAVSGTFPWPKPQKSALIISDRLHGYAKKCIATL